MVNFSTRLVDRNVLLDVIEANILTGFGIGKSVFIPRIPLIPSGKECSCPLRRLQLLLRLCFAMSINKSLGKIMTAAGFHLGGTYAFQSANPIWVP